MSTDMLNVRDAAELVGRNPETIRRWVWSGRLRARRQGNRLMIARRDLQALAPATRDRERSVAEWNERARAWARESKRRGSSTVASEMVIEDRRARSGARAGR